METDSSTVYKGVVSALAAWVEACAMWVAADKQMRTYPKPPDNPVIPDAHGIASYEMYLADREANIKILEQNYRQADKVRGETFSGLYAAIPFYGVWFKTNLGYVRKVEGLPHIQYKSNDEVLAEVTKNSKSQNLPF